MSGRLWKWVSVVGVMLLLAVMVLPFAILQTMETEAVTSVDTPLELFADRYCRFMLSGNLWVWLLVIGIAFIVVALVMRNRKK